MALGSMAGNFAVAFGGRVGVRGGGWVLRVCETYIETKLSFSTGAKVTGRENIAVPI